MGGTEWIGAYGWCAVFASAIGFAIVAGIAVKLIFG